MVRTLFFALGFCCLANAGHASPSYAPILSPGEQCRAATAAAERGHGIPPQLLAAIGRIESGRKDPSTGAWGAWPWTINAEGAGAYYNSKAEAIAAVETLRAQGVKSIDVGCMQVNLMHHPAAFASLDQAFEPAVNADYAARFLNRLFAQTNDWTKSTARYHSGNPTEGDPYAAKVMSIWPEEQRKAGASPAPALALAPTSAPVNRPLPGVTGGLFASLVPPFPVPQAPRAAPPVPSGSGTALPYGAHSVLPTDAPIAPPKTAPQAGLGAIAGRGLDFYRAAPVRIMTTPRIAMRMPMGVLAR